MITAYKEQVEGLIDGGALLAIYSICHRRDRSFIMISGTITDASGRTLSGQTVEAFRISLLA